MSLPQCIEGCPQHETRVRLKQRHRSRTVSKTSLRGRRRRVQEISGKDVHNMKARRCCLIKRSPNFRASNPGFEEGQGGPGLQGCLGGVGGFHEKNSKKLG